MNAETEMKPPIEAMMTVSEVMVALHLSRTSIWKLVRSGKLVPVYILGRPRFPPVQIRRLQAGAA